MPSRYLSKQSGAKLLEGGLVEAYKQPTQIAGVVFLVVGFMLSVAGFVRESEWT